MGESWKVLWSVIMVVGDGDSRGEVSLEPRSARLRSQQRAANPSGAATDQAIVHGLSLWVHGLDYSRFASPDILSLKGICIGEVTPSASVKSLGLTLHTCFCAADVVANKMLFEQPPRSDDRWLD